MSKIPDYILSSISVVFNRKINSLPPTVTQGGIIIQAFLDTILWDSCSEEVRDCLIESFEEQLEKYHKSNKIVEQLEKLDRS